MLKKILIAFATLMGLVLSIGLVLPSKYRVERSTTVNASSEAVYAYVAHLERWQDWTPWNEKQFPGNQWMFGGPQVGVGAVRSWSGEAVGNGTLSLTEADPATGVAYVMSLGQGRPLVHGRISFAPAEPGTRVTWVDEGDVGGNPFAHYSVPLIRSRLGGFIEQSLAQLAKQVEAHASSPGTKPEPIPAPPQAEPPPPAAPVPAQAEAPSAEPAPVNPSAPPVEGSQAVTPPEDGGSPGSIPSTEGLPTSVTGEATPAPAASPTPVGEPAPDASVPVTPIL